MLDEERQIGKIIKSLKSTIILFCVKFFGIQFFVKNL
jgi:hypothetical protein